MKMIPRAINVQSQLKSVLTTNLFPNGNCLQPDLYFSDVDEVSCKNRQHKQTDRKANKQGVGSNCAHTQREKVTPAAKGKQKFISHHSGI